MKPSKIFDKPSKEYLEAVEPMNKQSFIESKIAEIKWNYSSELGEFLSRKGVEEALNEAWEKGYDEGYDEGYADN